jgi:sporulation protein YlmC with PRC-barrel domain
VLFSKMSGATVYGTDNKDIGSIDNVVLDQNGRIAAVVIKSGGFLGIGGKTIAVAMKDLKMSTDKNGKPRFTTDMTKNQLKSAQTYNLSPPKNTASGSSAPPAGGHPTTTHR